MIICTYVLIILHIQFFIFIICHIYLPSILTPHQSTVSGPEFFKSRKLWLVSPDLGFVAGPQLEMFGAHNTNISKIAILNDAKWRIYFDSIIYIYIILLNMIFGFCSLNLLGTPQIHGWFYLFLLKSGTHDGGSIPDLLVADGIGWFYFTTEPTTCFFPRPRDTTQKGIDIFSGSVPATSSHLNPGVARLLLLFFGVSVVWNRRWVFSSEGPDGATIGRNHWNIIYGY